MLMSMPALASRAISQELQRLNATLGNLGLHSLHRAQPLFSDLRCRSWHSSRRSKPVWLLLSFSSCTPPVDAPGAGCTERLKDSAQLQLRAAASKPRTSFSASQPCLLGRVRCLVTVQAEKPMSVCDASDHRHPAAWDPSSFRHFVFPLLTLTQLVHIVFPTIESILCAAT